MLAALYAIAIAVMTLYGVNQLWLAIRFARADRLRSGAVPEPDAFDGAAARTWPDVSVQIPLYNEPLVAERVIDACAQLEYPRGKLEIQVLDDSVDKTTVLAAERVAQWRRRGVDMVHIRRPDRAGYKAGALQNGLRLARGERIAIFDADFLPRPDFLRRTVAHLDDPCIGAVQARWAHLNEEDSFLTRIQAFGLDAHFSIEQRVRSEAECFINFNGTAGVWRRDCIEDAGGWEGDTIAEDLDLSYRAQMRGWQLRFLPDLDVPAELPSSMGALRAQQFRWAKGSIETARKVLLSLLRSDAPGRAKVEGVLHLTAHLVFPFLLIASLVHAPLLLSAVDGGGPGEGFFGWMSIGLAGFGGFLLAQLLAQRDLHADWPRRLRRFPAFLAGTIGLSLNNTRAVIEALVGRRTSFVRTPKLGSRGWSGLEVADAAHGGAGVEPAHFSAAARDTTSTLPWIVWFEGGLFVYSVGCLIALARLQEWAAVPFQALFAAGFGIVVVETFRDRRRRQVPE